MYVAAAVVAGAAIGAIGSSIAAKRQAKAIEGAADAQTSAAQYAADRQAEAMKEAANISASAQRYAADLAYKEWQEQLAREKPWYDAGEKGLNQLQYGLGLSNSGTGDKGYLLETFGEANPEYATAFNADKFEADPGYQFRLSEGMKALDRTAAARGNLLSGSTLKGAMTFNQGMASQEYQNAYNRYNTDQSNLYNMYTADQTSEYNRLAAMSGVGQVAAAQMNASGNNYTNMLTNAAQTDAATQAALVTGLANNQSNIATANAVNQGNASLAKANATASSYRAWGNALQQAVGGLANYYGGKSAAVNTNMGGSVVGGYSAPSSSQYTWGTGYTGNYHL